MNTAAHTVEVPFPQAFLRPKPHPFPSAPRYGRMSIQAKGEQTVRCVWRSCRTLARILRSLSQMFWLG